MKTSGGIGVPEQREEMMAYHHMELAMSAETYAIVWVLDAAPSEPRQDLELLISIAGLLFTAISTLAAVAGLFQKHAETAKSLGRLLLAAILFVALLVAVLFFPASSIPASGIVNSAVSTATVETVPSSATPHSVTPFPMPQAQTQPPPFCSNSSVTLPCQHKVRAGETMIAIARIYSRRYGIAVDTMLSAICLANLAELEGRFIWLLSAETRKRKWGDDPCNFILTGDILLVPMPTR